MFNSNVNSLHLKTIVKRQRLLSPARARARSHTQSCSCDLGECAWNYSRYLSRALWGNRNSASVWENLTWVSLAHTSTGKNSHELYTEGQHFWRLQVSTLHTSAVQMPCTMCAWAWTEKLSEEQSKDSLALGPGWLHDWYVGYFRVLRKMHCLVRLIQLILPTIESKSLRLRLRNILKNETKTRSSRFLSFMSVLFCHQYCVLIKSNC